MRSAEPLEPEVLAALEAIDATLQGEPVDPDHAELAELALILRDERPVPEDAFLARLDRRVADRFEEPARPVRLRTTGSRRRTFMAAATVLAGVCIAVAVAVPLVGSGTQVVRDGAVHGASSSGSGGSASGSGSGSSAPGSSSSASAASSAATSTSAGSASPGASRAPKLSGAAPSAPLHRGRDITQSARIGLQASPGRVAAVAQEVFDVIGAEHGDVLSSHVTETAGAPGFATFSLQVPAARLHSTLDRLSRLGHARVLTREDASADITSRIDNSAAALAGARARRRSLLRQLAATASPTLAARLQREAAGALTQIDRDQSALDGLHHQVADSTIAVTVSAPAVVPHPRHRHHAAAGFTFSRALHDAGRILVVAAGVALIALAVLVPLGLVVAVCAWVWSLVLRRRREGALGPS